MPDSPSTVGLKGTKSPENPETDKDGDAKAPEDPSIFVNSVPISVTKDGDPVATESTAVPNPLEKQASNLTAQIASETLTLNMMIDDILGEDETVQLTACRNLQKIIINKLLVHERNPPIVDTLIEAGIIDRCTEFLKNDKLPNLQLEAAWLITNVASGASSHVKAIVDSGAVEPLIKLLSSTRPDLADQAVWALGNIAGEGPDMRDLLIFKGILPPSLVLAETQTNLTYMQNTAWMISNLCRVPHKTPAPVVTHQCLPALIRIIQQGGGQEVDNLNVQYHAYWGLHYLTQTGKETLISEITDSGIVPTLVMSLAHQEHKIIDPCVLVLGNIVSSSVNAHTTVVLDAGILPFLKILIQNPNYEKEVTWLVSNIAAGTGAQRSALVGAGIIPLIVQVLGSERIPSQKEAAHTVLNVIDGGAIEQIRILISDGAIPAMVHLLDSSSSALIRVVLDALKLGLENLRLTNEQDVVIKLIEESGGFSKLGKLQTHSSARIADQTGAILDIILYNDEEDEDIDDD